MQLTYEDREQISCDFVRLSRFEMEEGMSKRAVAAEIYFCGSTTGSAETAKYSAEQRLRILNLLELRGDDWEDDRESIRECIQQLDGFIVRDPYAEWADPELEE